MDSGSTKKIDEAQKQVVNVLAVAKQQKLDPFSIIGKTEGVQDIDVLNKLKSRDATAFQGFNDIFDSKERHAFSEMLDRVNPSTEISNFLNTPPSDNADKFTQQHGRSIEDVKKAAWGKLKGSSFANDQEALAHFEKNDPKFAPQFRAMIENIADVRKARAGTTAGEVAEIVGSHLAAHAAAMTGSKKLEKKPEALVELCTTGWVSDGATRKSLNSAVEDWAASKGDEMAAKKPSQKRQAFVEELKTKVGQDGEVIREKAEELAANLDFSSGITDKQIDKFLKNDPMGQSLAANRQLPSKVKRNLARQFLNAKIPSGEPPTSTGMAKIPKNSTLAALVGELGPAKERLNAAIDQDLMEIQELLNSGLPIEHILLLVMTRFSNIEEKKLEYKIREQTAVEALERHNGRAKDRAEEFKPYREAEYTNRLADAGEKDEDGNPIQHVQLPVKPEGYDEFQEIDPMEIGLTSQNSMVFMQEIQVQQQRYTQMMQMMSTIISQVKELIDGILQRMR